MHNSIIDYFVPETDIITLNDDKCILEKYEKLLTEAEVSVVG